MRATLARLFGRVMVREISLSALGPDVMLRRSSAVVWEHPAAGNRETGWRPVTQSRVWTDLSVEPGANGVNVASVPCTVTENAVPRLQTSDTAAKNLLVSHPSVIAIETGGRNWESGLDWAVELKFPAPKTHLSAIRLPETICRSVAVRIDTGGAGRTAALAGRIALPAVRDRLALATKLPMTRRRAGLPAGSDPADAFGSHRRHLAAASRAPLEDVVLLASFPLVPLALVQQMAVTEDGMALRLWLRPDAVSKRTVRAAGLVTIVLGRRRSTGESIRSVMPSAASDVLKTEQR